MNLSKNHIDILLKPAHQSVSEEEIQALRAAMDHEEVEKIQEIKNQLNDLKEVEPTEKIKAQLLLHFSRNEERTKKSFIKRSLLRAAAAIIAVIGLGIVFNKLHQNSEQRQMAIVETQLKNMEVHEGSDRTSEEGPPDLKEETKYLMTMDFFSNAGLGRD